MSRKKGTTTYPPYSFLGPHSLTPSSSLASTYLALGLVLLGGPAHNEDLGGRQAQHAVDGDVLRGAIGSADLDEALKHRAAHGGRGRPSQSPPPPDPGATVDSWIPIPQEIPAGGPSLCTDRIQVMGLP